MSKLRAFTKSDWDAWAGAEGDNPKIREENGWIAIADANGIGLYAYDGNDDMLESYHMSCSQALAEVIVAGLPAELTHDTLVTLGFELIL